jgi:hypothetical protein
MTDSKPILTDPRDTAPADKYRPQFDAVYNAAVDFIADLPALASHHGAPAPHDVTIKVSRGTRNLQTQVEMRLFRDIEGRGIGAWHTALGGEIRVGRMDVTHDVANHWLYLAGRTLSGVDYTMSVSVPMTVRQVQSWFRQTHGEATQWTSDVAALHHAAISYATRYEQ